MHQRLRKKSFHGCDNDVLDWCNSGSEQAKAPPIVVVDEIEENEGMASGNENFCPYYENQPLQKMNDIICKEILSVLSQKIGFLTMCLRNKHHSQRFLCWNFSLQVTMMMMRVSQLNEGCTYCAYSSMEITRLKFDYVQN